MLRFTHVVNCESSMHSTSYAAQAKHFLFLRSDDYEHFPILERHFDHLCRYIDCALRDPDAAVYIHCVMGMNRSAALAIAYAAQIGRAHV